jgi:phage-related minor tail protein
MIKGPTLTPMALMGEAGPEAILPLRRGTGGKLVVAAGDGAGVNIQMQVVN